MKKLLLLLTCLFTLYGVSKAADEVTVTLTPTTFSATTSYKFVSYDDTALGIEYVGAFLKSTDASNKDAFQMNTESNNAARGVIAVYDNPDYYIKSITFNFGTKGGVDLYLSDIPFYSTKPTTQGNLCGTPGNLTASESITGTKTVSPDKKYKYWAIKATGTTYIKNIEVTYVKADDDSGNTGGGGTETPDPEEPTEPEEPDPTPGETVCYDVLETSNFTGVTYTNPISWTANQSESTGKNYSGATYTAQASSNKGFQLRTRNKTGITVEQAPNGLKVGSIVIDLGTDGGGVSVYKGDTPFAIPEIGSSPSGTAIKTGIKGTGNTITIDAPYFIIVPTNDTYCVVSQVTVNWTATEKVPVEFPFDPNVPTEMTVGDTYEIQLGLTTPSEFGISALNPTFATVTANSPYTITAVAPGAASFKASWAGDENFKEGEKEFSITVNAKKEDVTKFEYSAKTAEWDLAEDAVNAPLPVLNYEPADISVSYKSSNTEVATVSATGEVTAIGKGETTITATFEGNDKYNKAEASYTLTVKDSTPVVEPETEEAIFVSEERGIGDSNVARTETEGNIKFEFAKGSGSNDPKYYDNGKSIRLYASNTLTISSINGANIIRIEITYGGTKNTVTAKPGDYKDANKNGTGVWTGAANSVTFTNSSSGQTYVSSIKVYYEKIEEKITAPKTIIISPEETEIDTNTLITLSVDDEATQPVVITFSIDEDDYSNIYNEPFRLTEGSHTVYVKASNFDEATGNGGTITAQATYNVSNAPDLYTIVFDDNGKTSDETNAFTSIIEYTIQGAEYIASTSASTLYKATKGIKFGSGSVRGSLTLNLSDKGKVKANRIIVNAKGYPGDTSNLQLNGDSNSAQSLNADDFADYEFELDGSLLTEIKLDVTGKRGYVKAITVDFGGAVVQDPVLSVKDASEVEKGSELVISCSTSGAKLYGTIGSTELEGEDMPYTYTFNEVGEIKVDLVAKKDSYEDSNKIEATYTVYQVAATPTLNVSIDEAVSYGQELTIASDTEGATLYGNVGSVVLEGETSPYKLILKEAGEINVKIIAKADGYRDSAPLECSLTVDAPDGPATPVYSESNTVVEENTEITVTSAGAEKMTIISYTIDGVAYEEVVDGEEVKYTVDRMNRRFAVSAEKNGISTVLLDKFYDLGSKIEDTFIPIKEEIELSDGDNLILGIRHDFNDSKYYGFMGNVNTGEGMPSIKKDASFLYVEENDLVDSECILSSELPDGVLRLTVESAENGYYLKTKEGKYLKSATTSGTSDITLNEKKEGSSEYRLVYDEEIDQVYLVAPNNDPDYPYYAIQINTQGPIFASYKINHNAPQQWPALIFRQESIQKAETNYTLSLRSGKKQIKGRKLTAGDKELTYDSEAQTYSMDLTDAEIEGSFTIVIDDEHELTGHIDQATTDFHTEIDDCNEEHDAYVFVSSDNTSADSPIRLVLSNNEDAVALSTHPNEYHDGTATLSNATLEVSFIPFEGISLNVTSLGSPTGVGSLEAEDAEGEASYYNLQGVKVNNPERGIYIKVVNGKATKVVK